MNHFSGGRVLWLSCLASMITSACLISAEEKQEGGPVLPKWLEEASPAPLGGGLWPEDFKPADVVHPADATAVTPNEEMVGSKESWLRFIPKGILGGRAQAASPPAPALVNLPAEALSVCEKLPGSTLLMDPESLLTGAQTEDITRFLSFHAERAGIPAYFLIIGPNQALAPDSDLTALASGDLVRKPACLVVYPFAAPARARIFFSRPVSKVVEHAYLQSLSATCIAETSGKRDPMEQLQHFAMQLSIRLSWLERTYPNAKDMPQERKSAAGPAKASPVLLREVTPSPPKVSLLARCELWMKRWGVVVFCSFAVLVAGIVALVLLRRWQKRRLSQMVWILPDFDHRHPVRFGGPHCGGCGATVRFG